MASGILLKPADAADIATPATGKVTFFLDQSTGEPAFKDDTGTVTAVKGAAGANGSNGTNGADGDDGTVWREGTGAPDDGTGVDGDFYLNGANGDVYQRAAGTYSVVANIKGATGATGATGPSGSALAGTCQFRLTLESGVAVSTTDQKAKSTLYATPYKGNNVVLYDGASWAGLASAEVSLALSGLTSGKNYDVFLYDDSGTLTIELSAAWTNDTTRADALTTQDGVLVKSGTPTRLYVGTIRTTGTTTTEDSAEKRFVFNLYNQQRRKLKSPTETTDTWTYTTATFRQARGSASNQFEYVSGDAATFIEATVRALASNTANTTVSNGVGVDSTSVNSADMSGVNVVTSLVNATHAHYSGTPGLGYHFIAWLEWSTATGTSTWYGDAGIAGNAFQSGMIGAIWN